MNYIKRPSFWVSKLKTALPNSTAQQRRQWADMIIKNNLDINKQPELLDMDYKIASRYLWLLTDVGEANKQLLAENLVYLFDRCKVLDHIQIESSFANYWLICGIPIRIGQKI